eukprot:GHVT01064877.1.p1 GENE.GHVT01064877.1~~GHVT01064877.1.p1  ORF type:complete len:132 (+),score=16.96 GHVT01064877.1:964-1359(+)
MTNNPARSCLRAEEEAEAMGSRVYACWYWASQRSGSDPSVLQRKDERACGGLTCVAASPFFMSLCTTAYEADNSLVNSSRLRGWEQLGLDATAPQVAACEGGAGGAGACVPSIWLTAPCVRFQAVGVGGGV